MELPELLNQYLLSDLQANISYVLSLEAVAEDGTGEEAFVQWFQGKIDTTIVTYPFISTKRK